MPVGMKDSANLTLINKRTGNVDLFIDYANETTAEFKSERVYATKKGVNAIAWDGQRNGTLTVTTELFSLRLLAMLAGSDLTDGSAEVFRREPKVLGADHTFRTDQKPNLESISIYKLSKKDSTEHDGVEVPRAVTGGEGSVPLPVGGVSITPADKSLTLSWEAATGATSYLVKRDNQIVGQPLTNSFTDGNVTPETEYHYTVVAVNAQGESTPSAEVIVKTVAEGAENGTPATATQAAIDAAAALAAALASDAVTYQVATDGTVTLSDKAIVGDKYVIYYMTTVPTAKSFKIDSNKFADAYEIYADGQMREYDTNKDDFVQVHFANARPQSNFSLKQSAKEPTSLSIVFDLMPDDNDNLAEYKIIE